MGAYGTIFREQQHLRQWWVWLLVVGVAGFGWWQMVQQLILGHPVGDEPLPDWAVWIVWALIGVGLPALILSMRLVTEVTSEQVTVSFRPFHSRVIPLTDITQATARTYSPVKEYGGWGIKGWSKRNVAYNMNGDRGVQLVLTGDRRVLIGSDRPEELARAIDMGRSGTRATGPAGD